MAVIAAGQKSNWMTWKDRCVRTEELQATNAQLQAEVAERKRAEQALRQQLDRTSLLNQITRAIAEREGMESNFKITLNFLEEHLAIDFSRVYSWIRLPATLR